MINPSLDGDEVVELLAPVTCEGDPTSLNLPFLEGEWAHMKLDEDFLGRNTSTTIIVL